MCKSWYEKQYSRHAQAEVGGTSFQISRDPTECKEAIYCPIPAINTLDIEISQYGGRLQLVRSVLYAIQNYWCQIFLFPKRVMRAVEGICRRLLWTGGANENKKSPIAWEAVRRIWFICLHGTKCCTWSYCGQLTKRPISCVSTFTISRIEGLRIWRYKRMHQF